MDLEGSVRKCGVALAPRTTGTSQGYTEAFDILNLCASILNREGGVKSVKMRNCDASAELRYREKM